MLGRLAAALLLATALLAPAAQGDWLGFHGDALKTGYVPLSSYTVFQDVWWNNKTLASAQIRASPVLKDNVLVTADLAGLVRGLDAASGKELWSFKMPAGVESSPVIAGQYVYVVSTDGTLDKLNLQTGPKAGSTPPAPEASVNVGRTYSSPTENAGKLFVGNEAGEMRAYLASTLDSLWAFQITSVTPDYTLDSKTGVYTCKGSVSAGPIRGSPAVYDHKVFFGSMNGALYAVNEAGGGEKADGTTIPSTQTAVQWFYQTGDLVLSSPAINTRVNQATHVIFTSYDGKAYSFQTSPSGEGSNPCNGLIASPVWTYEVPVTLDSASGQAQVSKIESSPAAAGSRIFFGANNGKVYGIDSAAGTLIWEATAGNPGAPVTSSPAVANGIVVIGSQDKNVYWFNATDGKQLRTRFTTQSAVQASPAIDGSRAYVASQEGTLYAFGPEIPRRADLVVSSISAVGTSLQVSVKNQGDAKSTNTTLRIFVAGTFLTNQPVGALDPGASATVTYAANLGAGSVSVRALVDPDNTVTESNDSNNEMTQGVAGQVPATTTAASSGGKKGGVKIPALETPLVLGLLAAAALVTRRRR